MNRKKTSILMVAGIVLFVAISFAVTRFDRCEHCGNWYGPGIPHEYRHQPQATLWE
ncbi:MAG: hypothetical protein AAGG44_20880 [Planctomycetota bacterium]